MGLAFTNLSFLASNATVSIFPDVGLDIRPPVVSGDEFLSFVVTGMARGDGVMMCSNDIFTKPLVSWDVESFLPFDFA